MNVQVFTDSSRSVPDSVCLCGLRRDKPIPRQMRWASSKSRIEKYRCQRWMSPLTSPALVVFPVLLPCPCYHGSAAATTPSWDFLYCLWGSVCGAERLFMSCFIMLLESRTTAGLIKEPLNVLQMEDVILGKSILRSAL